MLTVSSLTVSFGWKPVLAGIDFVLGDRDRVGLVGVNGAGKSTLLRTLLGQLTPSSGKITFSPGTRIGWMPQVVDDLGISGEERVFDFLLSGRDIRSLEARIEELSAALGDPDRAGHFDEILRDLGEAQDAFDRAGGYGAESELLQIMQGMNLEGIALDEPISALSGGQKSKVAFARLLYSRPDALLLDEPTNHLDVASRDWVIQFLRRYPGMVVTISHDEDFLEKVVTKIIRLDEFTRRAEVFPGKFSDFQRQFAERVKVESRLADRQDAEEKRLADMARKLRGQGQKGIRQALSREKALEKLRGTKIERRQVSKRARISLAPNRDYGGAPLQAIDLHFGYRTGEEVIRGASFLLAAGEKFVIVGKNGAGKSTLLKLLAGRLTPDAGEVRLGARVDLGYYAQEHEDLDLGSDLLTEVSRVSEAGQTKLRAVLGSFLFPGDKVFQKIETLSPGERSRLALAKLALTGANLLLLDEPTNHLDAATREIVAETLRDYGGTIVVVSHETDFLERLGATRMLMLPTCEVRPYDAEVVRQYQEETTES